MCAANATAVRPLGSVRAKRRNYFPVVAGAIGIAVAGLIVIPLIALVPKVVVQGGFDAFTDAYTEAGTLRMLASTFVVVGVSTLLAVAVGAAFAWVNERTDARMGWLAEALPVVPMMVPPLAGAIGWLLLLHPGPGFMNVAIREVLALTGVDIGAQGPLNIFTWYGLIFVYVLYLVPHSYLTIAAALQQLDPSLEEASRANGAGARRTFIKVTMPAVLPAIASGALLALVIALALFSVPVLLGTQARIDILSVRIVQLVTFGFPPDFAGAVALGLVLVIVIGTAWVLQARLLRAGRHATIGGGRSGGTTKVRLGTWKWPARGLMLTYLLATTIAPFAALLVVSLQSFWQPTIVFSSLDLDSYVKVFVTDRLTREALRNSILLGITGATVAMAVAAVIVFFIQRNVSNPVGRIVDGATKLPGALSHVVVGVALIAAFAGPPFRLNGTLLLLFLGYIVLYMPQASVTAGSALGQIDRVLSEASLACGATQGRTFRKVAVPLMVPGLAAGWVFVFVLMAGDVTASVMLASTQTPVVGFAMLSLFQNGTYPTLAALGVVISMLTTTVVLGALYLARRRMSRPAGATN